MAIDARERARLRPDVGARLLLDRIAVDGGVARYAAWVITPDGERGYAATLDDGGGATLAALPAGDAGAGDAADAAVGAGDAAAGADDARDDLLMLARLTARGAARRVADGLPAWPPRILRWRGPGRGA